jgi:hypothetical protein
MNKKAILKFGVIMILGVVVTSAMSAGVLADTPTKSSYSDILNNTDGDGTSSNPHVVTTLDELQAVQGDLSAHYVLGNNINASETDTWNSGAGFTPIGNYTDPFSGNFDGQGYSVDGLYINTPNTNSVGLFGSVNSSDIKNIGVTNLDIQGDTYVGGLVGYNKGSTNITNSYSLGSVTGDIDVGGLAGANSESSSITKSYSLGTVTGNTNVGGLVGETRGTSYIRKSYSLGSVTGNKTVGGLAGYNRDSSNITNSFSSGAVSGNYSVGGLAGKTDDTATLTDSYWNVETSTQSTSSGSATGLTTADMTGSAASTNMVGFDFTSVWSTVLASDIDSSADSYPILDSVERQAQLVSADVYETPTYTVDVLVEDSAGTAISGATVDIDGTDGATQDLANGTYTITASADSYETLSQDVTVDGANKTVTLTLSESTYTVDVIVEDSSGTAISGATVDIDGTDGATQDLTDGTYTITASADSYDNLSQDVTVDGANKTVTLTLSELYSVDVSAFDSEGNAIDNATIMIDGTETSTSDLTDGEYNISADATGYDLVSDTVVVNGSSESISLTLSETEYVVDIVVEDGDGNVVDSANVTFDGVDGLTHNVKDGDYELNVTSDNYVDTSQNVTVDGADETFTVTLSEEEEAVIVSDSGSEESGGMSTLVSASIVAFFGIFIMVVLLFGKD